MKRLILFPVANGFVSQHYGENPDLYKERFKISNGHNGVDVVSFHGDRGLAAERAVVNRVWNFDTEGMAGITHGYGVSIISDPDENGICREWLYWHMMSNIQVKVGQVVEQGDLLGFEGASGAVYQGGMPVPDYFKGVPPYLGTHIHWAHRLLRLVSGTYEVLNYDNGSYGYIDPYAQGYDIVTLAQLKTLQVAPAIVKASEDAIKNLPENLPAEEKRKLFVGVSKFLTWLFNLFSQRP